LQAQRRDGRPGRRWRERALLGDIIDGGRHRAAGTPIGGALGALVGSAVAQQQNLRCR